MKFKLVNRYSPQEKMYRLARVIWDGDYQRGPSRKLTIAVAIRKDRWLPGLFRVPSHEFGHRFWHLVPFPFVVIRIHHAKSFGGRFV